MINKKYWYVLEDWDESKLILIGKIDLVVLLILYCFGKLVKVKVWGSYVILCIYLILFLNIFGSRGWFCGILYNIIYD